MIAISSAAAATNRAHLPENRLAATATGSIAPARTVALWTLRISHDTFETYESPLNHARTCSASSALTGAPDSTTSTIVVEVCV